MVNRLVSLLLFLLNVTALAFGGYAIVHSGAAHAAAQSTVPRGQVIPQPDGWVAFSADVVVTHVDGRQTGHGRFYRDAHGCGRLETGPEGETAIIYIHNVLRSEYYVWNRKRGEEWYSGPMKLPAAGWKPVQRLDTVTGLEKHPTFVEVRRGQPYNLEAASGFTAYRYSNLAGSFSLQVPDLNFFEILKQSPEGRREVYSNIEVAPQPEEFFRPPDGAAVTATDILGGIVAQSPADAAGHLGPVGRGTLKR